MAQYKGREKEKKISVWDGALKTKNKSASVLKVAHWRKVLGRKHLIKSDGGFQWNNKSRMTQRFREK